MRERRGPASCPGGALRALAIGIALLAGLGGAPWRGALPAVAATVPTAAAPLAPRLIVLVVIDLFRGDLLTRHQDRLGPDGFRRLLRDGARFTSCAYPYALTETAPGHASIATGTTPDRHGIVSNEWYDRSLKRMVGAAEDPTAPLVGTVEDQVGASPRHLVGSTLADELRLATGGRAQTFGISLKPRATVFSVGRSASGAFWYDAATGRIVTSRYYVPSLPDWASAFNDARPADRYLGRNWSSGGRVLARLGSDGGRPDGEYYKALRSTPYIHDLLFEFARTIVERERLGADSNPDFLFLGLSGFDYLGHDVGPYSEAIGALLQAADSQLADFLRFLDERVGRTKYWLALTADHGISPTLRDAEERALHPREVAKGDVYESIRRAFEARFGTGARIEPRGLTTRLWLDVEDPARRKIEPRDAAKTAGEAALAVDGILGYIAPGASNLDAGTLEAYRRSTYPGRSPDLFLILKPFALVRDTTAANHGTPWSYDAQVPLFLLGPPFRKGAYHDPCTPADLAPTLAAALGLPAPAMATGRVLGEALRGD